MELGLSSPPSTSIKSKEYNLIYDKRSFNLKLSLSSNIVFEMKELEKIKGILFVGDSSLEDLVKLSKVFRICDNINEAYDIIEKNFDNKKASIKNINENEVTLIVSVGLPSGQIDEVNIKLYKKAINKDLIIEELIRKVNQLEEENKTFREKINRFERIEKLFEKEIKQREYYEKLGIDSNIIDKEDYGFIINRLINNDPILKQKKINFNLLYRATRDGDSINNFHRLVDSKKSTLSIIETTKGVKFGVHIDLPLNSTGNIGVVDDKCFIFRLTNKKIYNHKKGQPSFNDLKDYLIDLNCQPIRVVDNCLSNNNSYTCSKSDADWNFYSFERNYELNNNEQFFTVKEMETFQITFN